MNFFEGIVAVVTGAGSGIGRALATALVQRGAKVALADIDTDRARAVATELGDRCQNFGCDVSVRAQVDALARDVVAEFGGVNLVFANAGVAVGGTVVDAKPQEFEWMFEVNVGGTFSTMQAFVPHLLATSKAGGLAHFVATGSENSLGVPNGSPSSVYTATKHALLGLTDAFRRDLHGSGVGVSIFCPGVVNTDIWDSRRTRPERHGGAAQFPPEMLDRVRHAMASAQAPETTARLCLEGIEHGDFMIIMDPKIRDFWSRRRQEIDTALDVLDARLKTIEGT